MSSKHPPYTEMVSWLMRLCMSTCSSLSSFQSIDKLKEDLYWSKCNSLFCTLWGCKSNQYLQFNFTKHLENTSSFKPILWLCYTTLDYRRFSIVNSMCGSSCCVTGWSRSHLIAPMLPRIYSFLCITTMISLSLQQGWKVRGWRSVHVPRNVCTTLRWHTF